MANIIDEMRIINDKAAKWDSMKGRYVELAKRLVEANKIIDEVMKELDPVVAMSTRTSQKEIIDSVFNEMRTNGREFTFDQLVEFSGGTENQARYIWENLRKTEGIDMRSDVLNSRKKVLFFNKRF